MTQKPRAAISERPRTCRHVLALGLTSSEMDLLTRDAPHATTVVHTVRELQRLLMSYALPIAIADTCALSDADVEQTAALIAKSRGWIIHLGRLSATSARHRLIAAKQGADLRVVVRGLDQWQQLLREADVSPQAPDATSVILRALPHAWTAATKALVTEATILGRQGCPVSAWAAAKGESQRSLERHLRDSSLPTAKTLLTWTLAVHTSWRIDVLGLAPKRAAALARVSSPKELTRRLSRISDPHIAHRSLRFSDALRDLMSELACCVKQNGIDERARDLRRLQGQSPMGE